MSYTIPDFRPSDLLKFEAIVGGAEGGDYTAVTVWGTLVKWRKLSLKQSRWMVFLFDVNA